MSELRLDTTWRNAFSPPDRRPTWQWAADFVEMPATLTIRGKFNPRVSPHFNFILDAVDSPVVREVNVMAGPRSGKSLISDLRIVRRMAEDGTVLCVMQSDDMAKSHAELRLMKMMESCERIAPLLPADHNKIRKQSIILADGRPLIVSGPAVGRLQSRGFSDVSLDEVWDWEPGRLAEAKARVGDFLKLDTSKVLTISQAGTPDGEWAIQHASGVQHVFAVPCLGPCGRYFLPAWSRKHENGERWGIIFDAGGERGSYDEDLAQRTVRFRCPYCGYEHGNGEHTRAPWKQRGKWVLASKGPESEPASTFHRYMSFTWNSLIDYPWSELVKEWIAAQRMKHLGNYAPLVVFIQKRLSEHANEYTINESDAGQFRTIAPAADPTQKTDGEVTRLLTVDRQADELFWLTVRAWGSDGRSWRLHFSRVFGFDEVEAVRKRFNVHPTCTVVDSGYKPRGDTGVYAACVRYGWVAAKGEPDAMFPHAEKDAAGRPLRILKPWAPIVWGDPGEGTGGSRGRCRLVRFSAPTLATRVKGLIKAGLWLEPKCPDPESDPMEREYQIQMSAEFERQRVNKTTGRTETVWVCPSGNNHAFDLAKMQVLGAMHLGLLPSGSSDAG